MGYHHDHDWLQDLNEPLYDPAHQRRAMCQELQPHEVRRMIWEGATLVQWRNPPDDSLQGSIQVEAAMEEAQVRALLPDLAQPLLCIGLGGGEAVHESAGRLADFLLNFGFQHVFRLAQGTRHAAVAGG